MHTPRQYPIAYSMVDMTDITESAPVPTAHVRPGVKSPAARETLSPEAMDALGASGMLVAHQGHTWFEIDIPDLAMSHVRCRIAVEEGQVQAVFEVDDKNTQRLLEASAGRLRNMLEARGLRVSQIQIVASEA